MVVLAIIALIALYYALRSPRDMEEQHGGTVDSSAKRGALMAGTFVYVCVVGALMLGALWVAVNVAEVARL
jgi:Ca2+/Na+ antiporter